jgi:hypothetical protein
LISPTQWGLSRGDFTNPWDHNVLGEITMTVLMRNNGVVTDLGVVFEHLKRVLAKENMQGGAHWKAP